MCQNGWVTRLTREESTARTRERVIAAAQRLFRERGYAATSLEQIADAAEVTKGAIYGHFATKEDLLLSAFEATPTPDYSALLNDAARPLRERLRAFGEFAATDEATNDRAESAANLEFVAALMRNPEALRRFADEFLHKLGELADADVDPPLPGVNVLEVWLIGQALFAGLQLYRFVAPESFTPQLFARAFELLAGLYPDEVT
jgi:AcrR family transcriptional regulator